MLPRGENEYSEEGWAFGIDWPSNSSFVACVLRFPGEDQQPGSRLFRGAAAGLRRSHCEF